MHCALCSPIELKIFARQIRDTKKINLRVLDISSSNLDDECLYQGLFFIIKIEHFPEKRTSEVGRQNRILKVGHFSDNIKKETV